MGGSNGMLMLPEMKIDIILQVVLYAEIIPDYCILRMESTLVTVQFF